MSSTKDTIEKLVQEVSEELGPEATEDQVLAEIARRLPPDDIRSLLVKARIAVDTVGPEDEEAVLQMMDRLVVGDA